MKLTYAEAINRAIKEEMRKDPTVYCIGEDIGIYRHRSGQNRVCAGLLDEFTEKRVIETPIAESTILGSSVGAAMFGMRPIAEVMVGDFIITAAEHLLYGGSRGAAHNTGVKAPMVVMAPCGGTREAEPAQQDSVEPPYTSTPGLKIVMPSCAEDAYGLMKSSIRDDYPVLFLMHNAVLHDTQIPRDVADEEYYTPLGKADVKKEGKDVTIVSWSNMVNRALEAADELAKENISVEVVDLRTILPLDIDTVMESLNKTGKVLVLHESRKTGGYGAEVMAQIVEASKDLANVKISRLTGPDIHANFPPRTSDIVAAVKELAK